MKEKIINETDDSKKKELELELLDLSNFNPNAPISFAPKNKWYGNKVVSNSNSVATNEVIISGSYVSKEDPYKYSVRMFNF
jgi:hypothetical protein